MRQILNFINGEFIAPTEKSEWVDVYNPATGQVYAKLISSDAHDVDSAVACAKRAYNNVWSKTPTAERAAFCNKIADAIEKRLEEFALAESMDQGKSITTALTVDIPRAVANFRFYAQRVMQHEEKSMVLDGPPGPAISYTTRQPLGVVGVISPWNLPLYLETFKVAIAIAAGNTVVLKPSEFTPLTASMLGEVCREVGLPAGVVNIVHGLGPRAGQPLLEHPDVPAITFTGGTVTGRHIARTIAPMLKKMSLELGGKNATVVFADVNMDECIQGTVRAAFANQGEVCLCGSRILVERSIYDEYVAKFVAATKALRVGDPSDPQTFCGAIVSKEHRNKIISYIKLAEEEGGKIECGGADAVPPHLPEKCNGGYYVMPTVVTGLANNARCNMEEVFGPFVSIAPFDTEREAVDIANSVEYGLSASVWSTNIKTCQRVAMQLHVGYVWINCWLVRDLRAPFGGMKNSGIGREGGEYALEFYTEVKTICSKF